MERIAGDQTIDRATESHRFQSGARPHYVAGRSIAGIGFIDALLGAIGLLI